MEYGRHQNGEPLFEQKVTAKVSGVDGRAQKANIDLTSFQGEILSSRGNVLQLHVNVGGRFCVTCHNFVYMSGEAESNSYSDGRVSVCGIPCPLSGQSVMRQNDRTLFG